MAITLETIRMVLRFENKIKDAKIVCQNKKLNFQDNKLRLHFFRRKMVYVRKYFKGSHFL
jgi:hypothetical protein